jgi:hypothetical protein
MVAKAGPYRHGKLRKKDKLFYIRWGANWLMFAQFGSVLGRDQQMLFAKSIAIPAMLFSGISRYKPQDHQDTIG